MTISLTKDRFLSNERNKQNIVNLLGNKLQISGYDVVFAKEDADLDIALTAVNESLNHNVTVVGEDTDLLILLLYYCSKDSAFRLLFQSDKHAKTADSVKHVIHFYCRAQEVYCFCIASPVVIQPQDFMVSES